MSGTHVVIPPCAARKAAKRALTQTDVEECVRHPDQAIQDRRDASLTPPAVRFDSAHPPDRQRLIRPAEQLPRNVRPVGLQVVPRLMHSHPVPASRNAPDRALGNEFGWAVSKLIVSGAARAVNRTGEA